MARIFVSYRRQDDAYAAILKQHLEPKFGKGSLFIDTHSIPVGVDFRTHIDAAVAKSDAMLVVIGKNWLEPGKPPSRNRLFEQGDLVLAEIEAGLARGITVFPVLVGDAKMPAADDLPTPIHAFSSLNATEVRAGRDLEHHLTRLVDDLRRAVKSKSSKSKHPGRTATQPSALEPVPKARNAAKTVSARSSAGSVPHPLTLRSLRRAFEGCSSTYVGSSIPANKLHNALQSYGGEINGSDVLALHDQTVFGGARNGFLLTRRAIHWRHIAEEPGSLPFSEIKSVRKGPSTVKVNEHEITVSDETAKALSRVLKEILSSRS
jgi:hypothetical protein